MGRTLVIAAAIVLAGAMVALGLFFGLQRSAPVATAPAPQSRDPQREALASLEALKPALRATCWEPAVHANPQPATAAFQLDVAFDGTGRQVAQGVIEPREGSRNDVALCLRQQPLALKIAPPGQPVHARLPLSFP